MEYESKNCLINSEKRLTVALGLENIMIIETIDAILVANKDFSEKVKNVVNDLNKKNKIEGVVHKKFIDLGDVSLQSIMAEVWKIKK